MNWAVVEAIGSLGAGVSAMVAAYLSLGSVQQVMRQIKIAEEHAKTAAVAAAAMEASVKQLQALVSLSYAAKRVDILLSMTPRFDQLYSKLPRPGQQATEAEKKHNVRAYWSLQLEQFRLYVRGFVDNDVLRYWIKLRHREYYSPDFEDFQNKTREAIAEFEDQDFSRFMSYLSVYKKDSLDRSAVDSVMEDVQRQRGKYLEKIDPDFKVHLALH